MILKIEGTPLEYAQNATQGELKKVIKSIKKSPYNEWNDRCRLCFERFLEGSIEQAHWWSYHAELVRPNDC